MSIADNTEGQQTEQLAVLYCDLSHTQPAADGRGSEMALSRVNCFRTAHEIATDHGGREATTAAGGWIATFDSTIEALVCARDLSTLVGRRTAGPASPPGCRRARSSTSRSGSPAARWTRRSRCAARPARARCSWPTPSKWCWPGVPTTRSHRRGSMGNRSWSSRRRPRSDGARGPSEASARPAGTAPSGPAPCASCAPRPTSSTDLRNMCPHIPPRRPPRPPIPTPLLHRQHDHRRRHRTTPQRPRMGATGRHARHHPGGGSPGLPDPRRAVHARAAPGPGPQGRTGRAALAPGPPGPLGRGVAGPRHQDPPVSRHRRPFRARHARGRGRLLRAAAAAGGDRRPPPRHRPHRPRRVGLGGATSRPGRDPARPRRPRSSSGASSPARTTPGSIRSAPN